MLRLLGAALVTVSASFAGFGFARGVRRQCAQLEGLLWALDFMQAELSARLTPLPQLFSMLSSCRQTDVAAFFGVAGRALSVPPGGCFYAGDAKLEYRLIRQTAEPISAAAKRTYGERLRTLVKPPEGLRGRRGGSRRFR